MLNTGEIMAINEVQRDNVEIRPMDVQIHRHLVNAGQGIIPPIPEENDQESN